MKRSQQVLLASTKNVGKTLTPQNVKFPGLPVWGNKCHHGHAANRGDSVLFHHRAGNDYDVNAKSTNLWKRQVSLSPVSCYLRHLAPYTQRSRAAKHCRDRSIISKLFLKDILVCLSLEILSDVTAGKA